jgi:hypothetical protein
MGMGKYQANISSEYCTKMFKSIRISGITQFTCMKLRVILVEEKDCEMGTLGMWKGRDTEYTECQVFSPVPEFIDSVFRAQLSELAPPAPSAASECSLPPTSWFPGGTQSLGIEGRRGSQFGRRDRHSGTLGIL